MAPLLPVAPPAKVRPRADFAMKHFRVLIESKGLRVLWEMAALCPCQQSPSELIGPPIADLLADDAPQSPESRTDCPLCRGTGTFYHSPQSIKAIVTGAAREQDAQHFSGELARGQVFFSLQPEHLPSWRDRYTLQDSVMIHREIVARGAGALDEARYPVALRALELASGPASVGVLYCHKAAPDGQIVVEGEMTAGVDFEITEEGRIDWTIGQGQGSAPAEGDRYTISYYAHPRYVVMDDPHAVRDTFDGAKRPEPAATPMLVQVRARLEHLASDL